jgi:hypothetical protein
LLSVLRLNPAQLGKVRQLKRNKAIIAFISAFP